MWQLTAKNIGGAFKHYLHKRGEVHITNAFNRYLTHQTTHKRFCSQNIIGIYDSKVNIFNFYQIPNLAIVQPTHFFGFFINRFENC